jgi:dTDP-4-amino-4,6-dideoxygalactose transaminase
MFAENCHCKVGVSFGSGRMALYAILEALDVKDNDEVIIPAFTCVVVPNAIIYRGAIPVYADIDPFTFNIDVSKIEALITPRTKALYAQHTFGLPCDFDEIKKLASKYQLFVIEDAAHAIGAFYKGQPVGSLGDMAFFSTDHSKIINTHTGGIIVTNDLILGEKVKSIQQNTPFLKKSIVRKIMFTFLCEYIFLRSNIYLYCKYLYLAFAKFGLFFYFNDEMKINKPETYPYPCRLSSFQALIGISQLKAIHSNIAHRVAIAEWLDSQIKWNSDLSLEDRQSSWLRYSFLVKNRDELESKFSKDIELGIWFKSVVEGRYSDLAKIEYQIGSCPQAEFVTQHIFNFPTHNQIHLKYFQSVFKKNWKQIERSLIKLKV